MPSAASRPADVWGVSFTLAHGPPCPTNSSSYSIGTIHHPPASQMGPNGTATQPQRRHNSDVGMKPPVRVQTSDGRMDVYD